MGRHCGRQSSLRQKGKLETRDQIGRDHSRALDDSNVAWMLIPKSAAGAIGTVASPLALAKNVGRVVTIALPFFCSLHLTKRHSAHTIFSMVVASTVYCSAWGRCFRIQPSREIRLNATCSCNVLRGDARCPLETRSGVDVLLCPRGDHGTLVTSRLQPRWSLHLTIENLQRGDFVFGQSRKQIIGGVWFAHSIHP